MLAPAPAAHEQELDDPLATPDQGTAGPYQGEASPASKHITEAAMRAAEEIRQGRKTDRVLDETTAVNGNRTDS